MTVSPAVAVVCISVDSEGDLARDDGEPLLLVRVDVFEDHTTRHAAPGEAHKLTVAVLADGGVLDPLTRGRVEEGPEAGHDFIVGRSAPKTATGADGRLGASGVGASRSTGRREKGDHQAAGPSSFITAGTSTARTSVASRMTAKATPNPISLTNTSRDSTRAPMARARQQAAAVTMPPVCAMPRATASSGEAPASCSSLILP